MYQFFVEENQIRGHEVVILGEDVNHIQNVLRMKPGEEIAVSDGHSGREYRCRIEAFEEEAVICSLCFVREAAVELPSRVYLFQGLPKGDKMETVIQKAVELGVYEVIPMACRRSVMKLEGKKKDGKIQRWNAISEAAAKQSKRGIIPTVADVMTFREAAAYAAEHCQVCLIPYELAGDMGKTRGIFEKLLPGQDIAVMIGPEGGFDDEEIRIAMEKGIEPITLGKRILRTETAGMTVLSWIVFRLEDMQ